MFSTKFVCKEENNYEDGEVHGKFHATSVCRHLDLLSALKSSTSLERGHGLIACFVCIMMSTCFGINAYCAVIVTNSTIFVFLYQAMWICTYTKCPCVYGIIACIHLQPQNSIPGTSLGKMEVILKLFFQISICSSGEDIIIFQSSSLLI